MSSKHHRKHHENIRKFCLEESKQQKNAAKKPPAEKKYPEWTPHKERKAATRNQNQQQPTRKAATTPLKATNCFKKEESRKRPREPMKIPGEIFEQASKKAALQNSELFDVNRSLPQIDTAAIFQTGNTRIFDIDSNTNANQKIIASNDASLFMHNSQDSPPIGTDNSNPQISSPSHKSAPKVDKAVRNIKAVNTDSAKTSEPKVVFLDETTTKTEDNIKKNKA